MCVDAGNFYLATPLDYPEYMRILVELVPQEFIDASNLASKIKFTTIRCFSQQTTEKRLEEHDYYKVDHTPGRFTHKTCPIWFTLVVDDFEVKYIGKQHAGHLMNVLKQHYDMEEDW